MSHFCKAAVTVALLSGGFLDCAHALPRVWVSPRGADVGTCGSATSPCKTFQFAATRVDPKGEIDVRDPGDFGPLIIDKSLSIVNHAGGTAAITNTAHPITITPGAADVYIHGLTIKRCTDGILLGGGTVLVSHTIIRDCHYGIRVTSGQLTIRQSIIQSNSYGASGFITAIDTLFEKNFCGVTGSGLFINSKFFQNYYGIYTASRTILGKNVFHGNNADVRWSERFLESEIYSFQDNYYRGGYSISISKM